MAYTTINKSTEHFNTTLHTGNGSTQSITGVGFQPDLTWIKRRSADGWHWLTDAVRGTTKTVYSNETTAEETNTNGLTAFGTDGFTVGSNADINGNGQTHVGWNWKANGAGSSNTDGTITSTVSVNTTSGFSIVSYTGNGTGGATIGHGLGVKPSHIMIKSRSSGTTGWYNYHSTLTASDVIHLNSTSATNANSTVWNNTEPTSSVFSIGTNTGVNTNGDNYIAYCFAELSGYSKFGSYTGNANADGTFIYTGFKPTFVMVKKTGGTGYWVINDNKRTSSEGGNGSDKWLYPNVSDAEYDASLYPMDLLSNGFKLRHTGNYQNSSTNYIYMAFGQSLVGSNNVPCTAR